MSDLPPSLLSMTQFDDEDDGAELPQLDFDDIAKLDSDADSDTSTASQAESTSPSPSPTPSPAASLQRAGDSHREALAAGRPRGNTRVIAVDEAEAANVFLSHVDSDDESEMPGAAAAAAAAAAAPAAKSSDGFHQRPLSQSGKAASAGTAAIQYTTKTCFRCSVMPYTVKMSLKVGHPVEHFKLMSFCTVCAIVVQGDKVEAAKMANGDVAKAIADRDAQAPLRKPCERCKKRTAHTVTDWDKKKRVLTCATCITEHKDFKQLSQYALSCVVNLDFNAARQSFLECLQMAPGNASVFYNLACIEALTRHPELGLKLLRSALENGYNNWKQVNNDEDLARVRALPEFVLLVAEFQKGKGKLLSPRSPR